MRTTLKIKIDVVSVTLYVLCFDQHYPCTDCLVLAYVVCSCSLRVKQELIREFAMGNSSSKLCRGLSQTSARGSAPGETQELLIYSFIGVTTQKLWTTFVF